MTILLIGSNGRLGQAIANEFLKNDLITLERQVYEAWSLPYSAELIGDYFEKYAHSNSKIIICSGLLDPTASAEDLLRVNYFLPKNIIDGVARHGIKVITFGTVMEGLLQTKNAYIQSKVRLSEYVQEAVGRGHAVTHLQLHTLFGLGQPISFMFLGQMMSAIRENQVFKMTSGRQLREYHHLLDEVKAIRKIIEVDQNGVMNLSHGKPLSLRMIAESIFAAFGKSEYLRLGALPEPVEENYGKILIPSELLDNISFRDSLPAIVQYMQTYYLSDMKDL